MLKKPVKYKDYNGEKQEEVFYFNLSEPELIDMEMELHVQGGMKAHIDKIIEAKNQPELVRIFKKLVLESYGIKSDDGKRFDKSEEIRKSLYTHAAYPVIYMELATSSEAAADFIIGIMPENLGEDTKEAVKKQMLQQQVGESLKTKPWQEGDAPQGPGDAT